METGQSMNKRKSVQLVFAPVSAGLSFWLERITLARHARTFLLYKQLRALLRTQLDGKRCGSALLPNRIARGRTSVPAIALVAQGVRSNLSSR